ncbi:MAG: hypothetical protein C4532_13335 [Candidatus Abyssobacteria bacterium SURF_17]|uniref:Glycosyltransferase RgtA/B/C/D-like domain-containing protein n=1 Tax=Candidatus Abyssobacteria bacterium SURF_17 TaxID=2093361 RepID=A0A419EUP5_9BACT|nr:MAG: hypothetical protein C4532_13335 [Candidatus Abyssubacteria bacterium SURF_17]
MMNGEIDPRESGKSLQTRNREESTWRWILAACFVTIAAAPLYRLTAKSFWLDEAISAYYSEHGILTIAKMSLLDYVPPLYYWLISVYSTVFGQSDFALRFFSVFFHVASAVYLYRLVKEHFDKRVSLYVLIFFAASNYLLMRAQTARAYPLFLFLTMAAIYYFFRASEDGKNRWWPLYALCLLCSIYTLYLAVATVSALFVFVAWSAARKLKKWHVRFLLWTFVGLIAFLPWAILLTRANPSEHPDWFGEAAASGNVLKDMHVLFIDFFGIETLKDIVGRMGGTVGATLFLCVIGAICLYSLVAWWNTGRARKILLFAFLYVFLSLLVNFTLNVFSSVNLSPVERYIFLCPFVYVVVAAGISKLPSRVLQAALMIVLISPNLVAMARTYASDSVEDWRDVARYIGDNWQADDLIIFVPGYINIAFDRYAGKEHREIGYPKGLMSPDRMYWGYHAARDSGEADRFLHENAQIIDESDRIWLIHSHNIVFDFDKRVPDASMFTALENKPWLKQELFERFRGVYVYRFQKVNRQ